VLTINGKVKAGLILLSIALIIYIINLFLLLTFDFTTILSFVPFFLIFIGTVLLYTGLSSDKQGIMLVIMGGIFTFVTVMLFIMAIPYTDIVVVLSITCFALFALLFVLPGIFKITTKTNITSDDSFMYLYSLAPITVSCLLIYTIVVAALTTGASLPFIGYYFQYFFVALGLGILASLIVIFFWWLS